jgi:beta-lactamase regulating signal transducer with metallopeptidase domain
MAILEFFRDYILVIVYDSFISLLIALIIIHLFRIKDTNTKILFLFLPIVKPFFVIIEDLNHNSYYFANRTSVLGFRLVSPNTIFERIDQLQNSPLNYSGIDTRILIVISLSIMIILLIRWLNLYFFYRRLSYDEIVTKSDIPEIFSVIDNFASRLKVPMPGVTLTHRNFFSPFVIGIKKSIIVLSPKLLDTLSGSEKEVLIAHEIAHIKRKDNLISWISLILKDMLFFNPFSHIAYYMIRMEQEKGCDKIILEHSSLAPKEIARNTITLILKIKNLNSSPGRTPAADLASNYNLLKQINYRIMDNRIKNILDIKNKKINMNRFLKVVFFLLFLFLLAAQLLIVIKISDSSFIFLR